jgi:formylglycine-generating enzyme required for sulfatase activity
MKKSIRMLISFIFLLAACAQVDLDAPVPRYETGVDSQSWALIPAGEFLWGQFNEQRTIDYDYEMMVTDVTTTQYVRYLNEALAAGTITMDGNQIAGYYHGDGYNGGRHEERIDPGDYIFIPLDDPALRLNFDGIAFSVRQDYASHPMTMVSWFGAKAYCEAYGWRLPTEMEWEKAARGTDGRPLPWGSGVSRMNANFYSSRDPFEDMRSAGSLTTPVGFYNGKSYAGYDTLDSSSPYGLYDMAGNVWQWTADVYEGQHYRYLRGGSKDVYDHDLRVWVRNNATPTYYSPGAGFRCIR